MRIAAEEILPIGTIVLLKEGTKRLMIFGIDQVDSELDEEFDYSGIIYPEGNLGMDSVFLFNHEDIEEIHFLGFNDVERQEFVAALKEAMNETTESPDTPSDDTE